MNELLINDFQSCCAGLLSPKVTLRTKSAYKLSEHLCNRNVIELIDSNNSFTWDSVVYHLNGFLLQEAEKLSEDEQKKNVSSATAFKKAVHGDLLLDVVKIANRNSKC